jgi:transcriptional regulator with XRE-family HTH domain
MNGQLALDPVELSGRIARLVQERGWNQEQFARHAGLNRQTARDILQPSAQRRLRNDTVCRCARALGLTVNDLRCAPLDYLMARAAPPPASSADAATGRLYEEATQPELQAWLSRNPERAHGLSSEAIDELLSLQGTGGPLTSAGVDHFVDLIERKQKMIEQLQTIACTEYVDMLEQFIALLYEKVQPYPERR